MSSAGSKGAEGPAGPLVNENFVTLLKGDFDDYLEEIERLRQQNAELVRSLDRVKTITDVHDDTDVLIALNKISRAAIAKATGGE